MNSLVSIVRCGSNQSSSSVRSMPNASEKTHTSLPTRLPRGRSVDRPRRRGTTGSRGAHRTLLCSRSGADVTLRSVITRFQNLSTESASSDSAPGSTRKVDSAAIACPSALTTTSGEIRMLTLPSGMSTARSLASSSRWWLLLRTSSMPIWPPAWCSDFASNVSHKSFAQHHTESARPSPFGFQDSAPSSSPKTDNAGSYVLWRCSRDPRAARRGRPFSFAVVMLVTI